MKRYLPTVVVLGALMGFGVFTGCPRNTFTIRIVNDADTARAITLLLDDSSTVGSDSEDLLDGFIEAGDSRRFFIDVADAEAVNADGIIVGCIEPGPGLSEIIDDTIPVAFTPGGQITVTITGANGVLTFDS